MTLAKTNEAMKPSRLRTDVAYYKFAIGHILLTITINDLTSSP